MDHGTLPTRRSRSARGRTAAAAALTAVALAVTAGCTSSEPSAGHRAEAAPRPSPTPTPHWNPRPASIAAVGDSITRGFDACMVLSDCPEASWATGSDHGVRSLATRLLGAGEAAARSWNYAKTGARMSDIPAQLNRAAAHRPELVTVMVGGNDACRDSVDGMTSVAAFRTGFERSLRQLRTTLPKTQVYVSSVPDLKRLWSEGRGNALGKQIWKLGICQSMLSDADDLGAAAVERRDAVYARVVAYNKALKDVCAKDRYCRYDGGAVFDYRFTDDQLSHWDWFHPSKDGQGRLAEIAYRNVTAASPPR
ncbi:SGNH/GDSL hydrolase family protein [Streptomyces sp. TLI_146]|uniref:SGNH/GDSL hydrolase family protein n=1 Tax=Streptomyces sp. TLI_146 TaxID=1938858 RepID=UPI000C700A8A|nr:SGNH/GDSL hydrolase family protein [Streptomyces sp. TLI_146]PKV85571.1 lysophospholipase L1-like esterase [Streptomyces sp. TLI_146]